MGWQIEKPENNEEKGLQFSSPYLLGVHSSFGGKHPAEFNDQLQFGQVFPYNIAIPPGPGGRYRSMNTTFQRSNERAPLYELPPIHTLATTVQKNISNINAQSSPGFDPFSTSFIEQAENRVGDDRGRRHTENVLLPFLLTRSICSCQTVSSHIFGTESKLRLYTKKVQLRPQKIIVCWLSMAVSIGFLQTWSGTC
jgi:hypothetical protein